MSSACFIKGTASQVELKKTKMSVLPTAISLLLLPFLLLVVNSSSPSPLLVFRPRDLNNPSHINLMVMGCLDSDSRRQNDYIEDAVFFRNSEVLFDLDYPILVDPERVVEVISTFEDQIVFSIDLPSEGRYSCGVRLNERDFLTSPAGDFVGEF